MNKLLLGTLIALLCINTYADDLKVADDFESGDLVSADTFNQIFDTIEKINRTIVDTDLIGVWSCDVSEHSANTASGVTGWAQKGLLWELSDAQINMTASAGPTSKDTAYTISTSAPSPLYTTSNSASSGTYSLFEGMLFVNIADSTATHTYEVDIVSADRITLKGNAELGPPQPTFIVCDSAEAVPASPTSPTATNDKTGINLAWTDASSDETGFKVYRKLSSETEAKVIATQTAATYSDTDLTEGQTAYYQVVAYNDNGESAKSKSVSATLDNTAPSVVSTTPENNEVVLVSGVSNFQQTFTIYFSEKVQIVCPIDSSVTSAGLCTVPLPEPISGQGVYNADRESPSEFHGAYTYYMKGGFSFRSPLQSISFELQPCPGLPLMLDDTITITLDKDWIVDANGVPLAEDYVYKIKTD